MIKKCEKYRMVITSTKPSSLDDLKFAIDSLVPDIRVERIDENTVEFDARCPLVIELFSRREAGLLPKDIIFESVKCQRIEPSMR